jgi:hypothetical protein
MIYGDFSDKSIRQAVPQASYQYYDVGFSEKSIHPAKPLEHPVPVII